MAWRGEGVGLFPITVMHARAESGRHGAVDAIVRTAMTATCVENLFLRAAFPKDVGAGETDGPMSMKPNGALWRTRVT